MMIAPVGSSANVTGSRIAMPADGPSPGITPTIIPSSTPAASSSTFWTVSSARMPCPRSANRSTEHLSEPGEDAFGQPRPEQRLEQQIQADSQADADRGVQRRAGAVQQPQASEQ